MVLSGRPLSNTLSALSTTFKPFATVQQFLKDNRRKDVGRVIEQLKLQIENAQASRGAALWSGGYRSNFRLATPSFSRGQGSIYEPRRRGTDIPVREFGLPCGRHRADRDVRAPSWTAPGWRPASFSRYCIRCRSEGGHATQDIYHHRTWSCRRWQDAQHSADSEGH